MTDEKIEQFEQLYGIKLLDCQKEMLKKYEPGDKLYVNMYKVRRQERVYLKGLFEVVKAIIGKGD